MRRVFLIVEAGNRESRRGGVALPLSSEQGTERKDAAGAEKGVERGLSVEQHTQPEAPLRSSSSISIFNRSSIDNPRSSKALDPSRTPSMVSLALTEMFDPRRPRTIKALAIPRGHNVREPDQHVERLVRQFTRSHDRDAHGI